MQIILSKYVEALPRPDPFGLAHVVLATFGMMAAVLLIAHHEPDTVEAMAAENHPSFEIRLVGVGEGIEAVLTKLKGPLDMPVTYKVLYAISQLRRAMETVVLGAPSKYMISL